VNRQVEKLTALVRDLVTVSKISLGQLDYDFTEFNFQEVLEDVEIYARQLSDHHKIEIKGEPNILMKADRNKIEQVLGNLVSNAIKYSNGNNTIIFEVQPIGGFLSVRVTDFGIGIPEEKQHLIFDRFYRVKSTDYTASGLGIGLYISLEIIKRHKGTLTVNSEPGKWTAFNLTIPIVN
jgi:two-component system CheB/CheR fusion protein